MKNCVIVSAVRTAIGSFNGSLASTSAIDLGATVIKAAIERAKIDSQHVDEVIMGNVLQAGLGQNPARQALLKSGLAETVCGFTVNKVCGSGLKSVALAAQAIQAGQAQSIVAGGMENMSLAPYLLDAKARSGYRLGDGQVYDVILRDGLMCATHGYHMGITAENVAKEYGITREMQDRFAVESHRRAEKAWAEGKYDQPIVPILVRQKKQDVVFDHAETYIKDAQYENFAKLKPISMPDGGTVTAGNASPCNDGSAVVMMTTPEKAAQLGLKPLARYVTAVSTALDPAIMGYAPVSAIEKLEKKTGISRKDVGLFELNEAFAAQAELVNVNGGAIALGHAVGCTGCRISMTLIREMARRNVRYGVASLCIGGGQAMAMMFELC